MHLLSVVNNYWQAFAVELGVDSTKLLHYSREERKAYRKGRRLCQTGKWGDESCKYSCPNLRSAFLAGWEDEHTERCWR